MKGNERRQAILELLRNEAEPVNGAYIAEKFSVSRQVVVQDIAILRANGENIISVHKGYFLQKDNRITRVFKVCHSDEQVEEELNLFVDLGGKIDDVFVYHKVYGVIKASMNIKSRRDVQNYIKDMKSGKSSGLKNITSDFHYHTISAEDVATLEEIQEALYNKGFLAKLQEYEPVDFANQ